MMVCSFHVALNWFIKIKTLFLFPAMHVFEMNQSFIVNA